MSLESLITAAARAIESASAIFIGAGAGMGVDSGLPDFRGPEGFWKAYPAFRGKSFEDISNPVWFVDDPEQAWGFFGHRLGLYRNTEPHAGFAKLLEWCNASSLGYFIYTSNVDGHFQRAGFDPDHVYECHGSIHHLQCTRECDGLWPADDVSVVVNAESIRAESTLPKCPSCGELARPNILMFYDDYWNSSRTARQRARMQSWLHEVEYGSWMAGKPNSTVVILEFGAGTQIPTVRHACETRKGQLIRINPRDTSAPEDAIVLPIGAMEAIERIDSHIS